MSPVFCIAKEKMKVPNFLKPLKTEVYIWRRAWRRSLLFSYLYRAYIDAPLIRWRSTPLETPITNPELSVHMLLCHRDLTMALWSLASYYQVVTVVGQLIIHSDGSLTAADRALISRLLPSARIIEKAEADALVESAAIPNEVKEFRLTKPVVYLKKLVDTSVVTDTAYHLLIDSDLAWLQTPTEIESAVLASEPRSLMTLNASKCPVYLIGDRKLSEEYARYNGGVIFFHRDTIDLERLIDFFAQLDMQKPQRAIGQSGHAYCLQNLIALPYERYAMRGPITDTHVMVHYTQVQRERFYTHALPHIKNLLQQDT